MEIDLCVRAEVLPFLRRRPLKAGRPMLYSLFDKQVGGNEETQ